MTKRLMAILIVALMLFAACNAAPAGPSRGYWDDRTFVSAYFGLRLDLPLIWFALSDEEIAGMFIQIDPDFVMIPEGSAITPDNYEMLETLGLMDLSANDHRRTKGIGMRIGRLSDDDADKTAVQFLENMIEEMSPPDTTVVTIYEETTRIGTLDWYLAEFIYEFGQNTMHNWYFVNIDGRFVRSIIISHFDDDRLDETLAMFRPY